MSQVEHRAEQSFAIKGTLVFTAQQDQFTIMEDAYLVCESLRDLSFSTLRQMCERTNFWKIILMTDPTATHTSQL